MRGFLKLKFSLLMALSITAATALAAPSVKGVYVTDTPGRWKDGVLVWKYNPALRPVGVTDAQILSLMTQGFANWARVCNITAQYGGTTTGVVGSTSPNEIVVGFADTGALGFADASPYSNDTASRFTYFTGGFVRINTNSAANISAALADASTLTHEIGHLLGLSHSEDPASIMFANPYLILSLYTSQAPDQLYGDDIEACGNLYGGKGLIKVTDYSQLTPDSKLGLRSEISGSKPDGNPSPNALTQVDNSVSPYFTLSWIGQNPLSTVTLRLIMPNGLVYTGFNSPTTFVNGYNYLTIAQASLPLAGKWQFQGLVDGRLGVAQSFIVTPGLITEPPKLEFAAIVEQTGTAISQRTVNYSPVATSYISAYLNEVYSAVGSTIPVTAGANHLEYWVKTTLPRYPLDLTKNQGGQTANSADAIKQVNFNVSNGVLSGSGIDIIELGTQLAYSARANIQSRASGTQGVYVAVFTGKQLFFRHSSGWDANATPLFTFNGPAAANFDVLRGFDIRQLPAGAALLVGYGATLDEVVAKNQYALVRAF